MRDITRDQAGQILNFASTVIAREAFVGGHREFEVAPRFLVHPATEMAILCSPWFIGGPELLSSRAADGKPMSLLGAPMIGDPSIPEGQIVFEVRASLVVYGPEPGVYIAKYPVPGGISFCAIEAGGSLPPNRDWFRLDGIELLEEPPLGDIGLVRCRVTGRSGGTRLTASALISSGAWGQIPKELRRATNDPDV